MVVSTWTPDWVVQVQAQVGVVALCVKAGGGGVNPAMDKHSIRWGGSANTSSQCML